MNIQDWESKIKQIKVVQRSELEALTFGKIKLYFNNQIVKSPYVKGNDVDYTDTTWTLILFKHLLMGLTDGITTEETHIAFLDNPNYLTFSRGRDDKIIVSYDADTNDGIIKLISVVVDESELIRACLSIAKKLREQILNINSSLSENEAIIQLNSAIRTCEERYMY